ncbi:MAG: hypothetical protein JWP20_1474 [Roseomonas sp.]|jgi:hypothetical protein|nr:hypothetical protein [Roseomonas sp.]
MEALQALLQKEHLSTNITLILMMARVVALYPKGRSGAQAEQAFRRSVVESKFGLAERVEVLSWQASATAEEGRLPSLAAGRSRRRSSSAAQGKYSS